jgi:TonB family protein
LLAMASRADLASRVNAVLDGGQRRGRAGALCVTIASALAAALVVTVSPLRVVAAPQPASTEARGRFRTDTRLVVTPVKVSDSNGNTVGGLSASDFSITEDGVQQVIGVFEFQRADGTEPPASYYILGYYSGNLREDGQFRKINIAVNTPTAAKLDYRTGYYATKRLESAASGAGATTAPFSYTTAPRLIFKKNAEYSEEARKAKYQGTVLLEAEVDASGKVVDIGVVRGLGLGLDERAIEAVQEWRFKPAEKDGKPVSVKTEVEVNFRLL